MTFDFTPTLQRLCGKIHITYMCIMKIQRWSSCRQSLQGTENNHNQESEQSSNLPGSPKPQACKIAVRLVKQHSQWPCHVCENKLKHTCSYQILNLFFSIIVKIREIERKLSVLNRCYVIFLITDPVVTVPAQIMHSDNREVDLMSKSFKRLF